jgi:ribokinase
MPSACHPGRKRTARPHAFADAALVLAQLETPLEATRVAFRTAREAGARTLLNVAPASDPIPADVFDLATVVVANAGEAATVTGCRRRRAEHA